MKKLLNMLYVTTRHLFGGPALQKSHAPLPDPPSHFALEFGARD